MFGRLFAPRAVNSEEAAYRRLHENGYRPASIIDVGAYEGNWTRLAREVFPDAEYLMVEPQASKAPLLQRLVGKAIRFEPALLSSESGRRVTFYEMETGSSMMPENSNVPRCETHLTTATLDQIATGLPGPTFLKIDAQGAELEILKGGSDTIRGCDMIQLEVALLPYNAGAPEVLETVTFMKQIGFVPYDFSGFTRPNGVDLVQVDIIFARQDSPLRRQTFVF
jgi:FkbM family methyltransferase